MPRHPLRPRIDRPYVGIPSFLRSRICNDLDEFDGVIGILGAPFDEGSPFMPGSRFGPRSIREHSLRFVHGEGGFYNPETQRSYLDVEMTGGLIQDCGDADIAPTNVERSFASITEMTAQILARGGFPVVIGGDHSITYPVVRAFTERLHVIHFDAHIDYSPFVHDLRFTNAHAFRHIRPMLHVASLIQVGIRSLRNTSEAIGDSVRDGNRVVTMGEFRRLGPEGIAALVSAGDATYVSIDVDALDLPLVPGCVSAEPNGMTYAELSRTLQAIAERTNVIGFDFVEVNPQLDVGTGVTSYLGAHTIVEFLGHICAQPRWAKRRDALIAKRR
ncbi:MAG TPA: arginase family protein [Stellaceae bacterium]|nr:arginase family protein [Stellaceae bacterium]